MLACLLALGLLAGCVPAPISQSNTPLPASSVVAVVQPAPQPTATRTPQPTATRTPQPTATLSPTAGLVSTADWKTYTVHRRDFRIQLPREWKVLDYIAESPGYPDYLVDFLYFDWDSPGMDAKVSIYAHYALDEQLADPYAPLIPEHARDLPLQLNNGHQARLFITEVDAGNLPPRFNTTHQARLECYDAVWIAQQVQRHVHACGLDANELNIFMTVAKGMEAPSLDDFAVFTPTPTAAPPQKVRQFFDAVADPAPQYFPAQEWQIGGGDVALPKSWTVLTDVDDLTSIQQIEFYATPFEITPAPTFSYEQLDNVSLLVSYRIVRTDDVDPFADFFRLYAYAQPFQMSNGHRAMLFAKSGENGQSYWLIWDRHGYYDELFAFIASDPKSQSYIPTVAAIFRSLDSPNLPPNPTPTP